MSDIDNFLEHLTIYLNKLWCNIEMNFDDDSVKITNVSNNNSIVVDKKGDIHSDTNGIVGSIYDTSGWVYMI